MTSKTVPQVRIALEERRPGSAAHQWTMAWRIENLGASPLEITQVWLPHGQFRAPRQEITPPLRLAAGESAQIETPVECVEPATGVVENTFVILRVLAQDEPWRIFARLRVTFDEGGGPLPTTELVTTQRVGSGDS